MPQGSVALHYGNLMQNLHRPSRTQVFVHPIGAQSAAAKMLRTHQALSILKTISQRKFSWRFAKPKGAVQIA
jgi:hypothetical protein